MHISVFPFISKGHTIPLLQLTKLIHIQRPQATFTIITTPANEPFISASLSSLPPNYVTILSLPFSTINDNIPSGVESTDQLPSMSLFYSFAFATKCLQPHFKNALKNLQKSPNPITFLISDGFLYWIQESVSKFNIVRLVFYGINTYVSANIMAVKKDKLFLGVESQDELIQLPDFPWIKVRKEEFDSSLFVDDPEDPKVDFVIKCFKSAYMSHGFVVNSFIEIEQPYLDYINSNSPRPKSWCVGPLCLVEKPTSEKPGKPDLIKWLDKKLGERKNVLYVAFGSQAEISSEQLEEITIGLEANFIWVSSRWFVKLEGLSKMVKELMEGDIGKKVRKNVEDLSEVAKKCVEEGGSSWCN